MVLTILLLILGLVLILKGADFLTDGAASVARKFNIPEIVIGLTIVSIGTSAPEFVVSVVSSLEGKGDVAIGNVVGSNLFNSLIILGVASLFSTIRVSRGNITRDVPFVIVASLLMFVLGCDTFLSGAPTSQISRIDGAILVLMFIIFLIYTLQLAKRYGNREKRQDTTPVWKAWLAILGGLGALIIGGRLFVDNAIELALALGASEHIVAIVLMAGGTSLPELATTIVAARKGNTQMAIGNIIGSNIFNILFVLGVSSLIHPLSLGAITPFDMGYVLLSSLLLFAGMFILGRFKIYYQDGIMFILAYIVYMIVLLGGFITV